MINTYEKYQYILNIFLIAYDIEVNEHFIACICIQCAMFVLWYCICTVILGLNVTAVVFVGGWLSLGILNDLFVGLLGVAVVVINTFWSG